MSDIKQKVITQIETEKVESIKPFIRWAGGKQNLVQKLSAKIITKNVDNYYEPFLGAGSLFFFNDFKNGVLSDINPHLINAYVSIKDSAELVSDRLMFHKTKLDREYYYKIREEFNRDKDKFTIDQAANFIFLVHTSFNGIYRVNKKGEYNVPFGKIKPAIPNLSHLTQIQNKLKSIEIKNLMYEDVLDKIKQNDFVYFDPPYPPLSKTSFFQHYSVNKFPESQQVELADYAKELDKKGVHIMISNAETPEIAELYKSWNIEKVSTYRYVNCKSQRNSINELIITNY